MNVERFNIIVNTIVVDESELSISQHLQTFNRTFAQNISQANPATAEAFIKARKELWEALEKSVTNRFSPSQASYLNSILATDYLGKGLKIKLERIIEENSATPGQAVVEVQKHTQLTLEFYARSKTLDTVLEELAIPIDTTGKDEYEVGILLPVSLINNNIEGLQKELSLVNRHLKIFGEIAAEETCSPTIRSVSSGSIEVFINSLPAVALFISAALERVVRIYLSVLQIRKLRGELKNNQVPPEALKSVEEYEKKHTAQELEKLGDELFKEYRKKLDKTRDKELRALLGKSLIYLAKRIDQGVNIEVTPPSDFEKPSDDAPEKEKQAYQTKLDAAQLISDRSAMVKELPPRDKPILFLPEADNIGEETETPQPQ